MTKMSYRDQLLHPNWQRKRLEVMSAADWKCQRCGDGTQTLHAHHKEYRRGALAWEYQADELECLCCHCHALEHGVAPPDGTLSARRSAWETLFFYNARACVIAADSGERLSSDRVSSLARDLCIADGLDYDAIEGTL